MVILQGALKAHVLFFQASKLEHWKYLVELYGTRKGFSCLRLLVAFVCNVKSFARVFLVVFFSFSFSSRVLGGLTKVISVSFFSVSALAACNQHWICYNDILFTFKPCFLEIKMAKLHHSICNLSLQSLKSSLCIHFHNACGHYTWQGSELFWGVPNHQVTWLFNYMVLWDHTTN